MSDSPTKFKENRLEKNGSIVIKVQIEKNTLKMNSNINFFNSHYELSLARHR